MPENGKDLALVGSYPAWLRRGSRALHRCFVFTSSCWNIPILRWCIDPEVQIIGERPAEMKRVFKWQLTTPQARCGATHAQSWLTTGAISTETGTGLPLLGVLSS